MHLIPPHAPAVGRIVRSEICTKGKSASTVRHVCIDVSGTALAGRFHSGQAFGVIPPGLNAHGKPHKVRLYSIASPSYGEDGHGTVLSTTVKRLIAEHSHKQVTDDPADHSLFLGLASNWLCDRRVGDEVPVTGPAGKRFVLPTDPNAHDFVLIATGTGIAPYRAMVHELLVGPPEGSPALASWRRSTSQIHLVMGSPYTTDLIYDDFFRSLAASHPNFHYHTVISRESQSATTGKYVHDAIAHQIERFGPVFSNPRTLIYICGLAGMQSGLFRTLAVHGLGSRYLTVDPLIAATPPAQWTEDEIKRRVRHTRNCMIEVY